MFIVVYSATVFVAAFLLFWIQPLAAKLLLPALGGSPAVWNTSVAFFQTVLLGGYGYAHLTARWLSPRRQAILHWFLLAAACSRLPIGFPTGNVSPGDHPQFWLLATLIRSVGLPFLMIAATAPMVQRWVALSTHRQASDPYFLYAFSNAGSLCALLAFPFLLEPALRLTSQERLWSTSVVALALLLLGCTMLTGSRREEARVAGDSADPAVAWRQRLWWLALSAAPSSLLLGVTTYISTDIAAVPLLWVVPLALYLGTFVLAFAYRSPPPKAVAAAQAGLVVMVGASTLWHFHLPWEMRMALHVAAFVATALMCHQSLAASRPSPTRLTEFYVWLAVGGALGGWFNAWISPLVFNASHEYSLVLALVCLLRPGVWGFRTRSAFVDVGIPVLLFAVIADPLRLYLPWLLDHAGGLKPVAHLAVIVAVWRMARRPLRLSLGVAALLLTTTVMPEREGTLARERNFFGQLRVVAEPLGETGDMFHVLYNGSIAHGAQSLEPSRRLRPTSYYHQSGPLGGVFERIGGGPRTRRVAVVGLGTGSISCYGFPWEDWTFFELNPAVERVARDRRWFSYLDDCPPRAKVIIGDARLLLAAQGDGQFNLIILDAFSSDAIPIHIVTCEALSIYLRKLTPDGLILVHVTNGYFQLAPTIARTAATLGLASVFRSDRNLVVDKGDQKWPSDWMAIGRPRDLAVLTGAEGWQPVEPGRRPWTDDFSDVLAALRW